MKKYFFCFCVLLSVGLQAQIQQNINKPSGTVSNAIAEIDSIRFNAAGDEMQVVLIGGTVNSHSISEIDSVTFIPEMANLQLHTCGADSVHNPALTYGSMTDQEGNMYKTIVIGTQEWMAENLRTTVYQNGNAIASVTNTFQWAGLTTGAWCYYNNESQYECPYGKLYNWYAVADPRNVCPTGWHVPTDGEWTTLTNFLGGEAVAGGKMKSTGTQYWFSPNTDATNASGFSGLPGGFRFDYGVFFYNDGDSGFWWSSTENNTDYAWCRNLNYNNGYASTYNEFNKPYGFSVRCLRD